MDQKYDRDNKKLDTGSDRKSLAAARDRLMDGAATILLATSSGNSGNLGVTPMIRHKGAMHIYPSVLSGNVRAMMDTGEATFLIIEDEAAAENIWARKRLTFRARVTEIARGTETFDAVCDDFAARRGATMNLIRDFDDFHLLRLTPITGMLVLGFAMAYELEGEGLEVGSRMKKS